MKRFLCLIGMYLVVPYGFAQQNFFPGTLTHLDGHTEPVLIKDRSDKRNHELVTVKSTSTGKETTYTPTQIRGYSTTENKVYLSGKLLSKTEYNETTHTDSIPVFLQQLVAGELSLYFYRGDATDRFFIQSNQGNWQELVRRTKIYTNGATYISRGNYEQIISTLTTQCPPEAYALSHLNNSRSALIRLIHAYDTCEQVNNLTYSYKPVKGKIIYGWKAGAHLAQLTMKKNYFSSEPNVETFWAVAPTIGFFSEFQIMDIDRRLYFQTELLYSWIHFNAVKGTSLTTHLLQLPLSFKYDLLHTPVTPYLYGGMYMHLNLSSYSTDLQYIKYAFEAPVDTRMVGGLGIKWKKERKEYSLDYRIQRAFLNSKRSVYEAGLYSHLLTFSYGWKAQRKNR